MAEYIEREDVREALRYEFDNDYADDITDRLPAADVAPVRPGRWRWCGSDRYNDSFQCSECGKMNMDDSNYCPHCGAKMDGGEDDA